MKSLIILLLVSITTLSCGPSAEEKHRMDVANHLQREKSAANNANENIQIYDGIGYKVMELHVVREGMTYKIYNSGERAGIVVTNVTLDSLQKILLECQINSCTQ